MTIRRWRSLESVLVLFSVFALSYGLAGCGADNETTSSGESVSEIAGSTVAGIANSTESNGSAAFNDAGNSSSSRVAWIDNLLFANATAANPACPTLGTASCVGQTITLTYNGCSFGMNPAVWNGSQILTFTSGCTIAPQSAAVSLTRTFGPGTTRTGAGGVVVTFDTSTASGFNNPVSGGTTITASGGNRTITINGIHYVATKTFTTKKGNQKTVTVWDHTVSTPTTFTITGSDASRSISSGTITVQHNLAKFTGSASITSPLTFSAGCCHPTGGKITTTLSGSVTGTETLTYGPTCGAATLVDNTGASSAVTLSHCL